MKEEIGKKIRALRKELNMTQSELANPEMTKSMLSHIENGKANPSMKTLQYIASKLNKPVSYFLSEDQAYSWESQPYKEEGLIGVPMEKLMETLKEADFLIKRNEAESARQMLEELLGRSGFKKNSKLYADIIYRLGNCYLILKDFQRAEELLRNCSSIYSANFLFIEAARACHMIVKIYMNLYNYNKCSNLIEEANNLYKKSTSRDIFFEIELLVEVPAVTLAQGDFEKTIEVCEKAISLSHESNLYYLTDIAYRLLANTYLIQRRLDKFIFYMDKAQKYVEFTGNKYILARINQNLAMYYNMLNMPEKAIKHLQVYEENTEERAFYYYIELARAKYQLGRYEDALLELEKINFYEKIYYRIDCIYILTAKVLRGQILSELNQKDEAIKSIKEAITDIEPYTFIEYKGFAIFAKRELSTACKSLSDIYHINKDYEEAYDYLSKSYELSKETENV